MVKRVTRVRRREYFQEYCNNTSIHGFKYIGGEKRTMIEKVVWLLIVCSAIGVSSYMIFQTYKKWESSPVVLRLSQNPTSVRAIPFPAVTICPQTKAKQRIYNFTKLFLKWERRENMTNDEDLHYNRLRIVCDYIGMLKSIGKDYIKENHKNTTDYIKENHKNTTDYIKKNHKNTTDYYEPTDNTNQKNTTDYNEDEYVYEYEYEYEYDYDEEDEDEDEDEFNKYFNKYVHVDIDVNQFETNELIHFLIKAAPSLKETFRTCIWNARRYKCENLFQPILTEEGLCFTFNMLEHSYIYDEEVYNYPEFNKSFKNNINTRSDWNAEHGYKDIAKNITKSYPRRVVGSGVKYGLEIGLRANSKDFDYVCKGSIQGFKVILHDPGEISKGRTQYIRIPLDQEVTVAIQPNVITTSPNLKRYPPKKRNCFFNEERPLKFFKNYTEENCKLECLTNMTLNECKCVAFYMPRHTDMKLCSSKSDNCTLKVENRLQKSRINEQNELITPCDCMPSCHSITYNADQYQIPYDWKKFTHAINKSDVSLVKMAEEEEANLYNHKKQHYSQLQIYFKDIQFISTERSELYGTIDFISSCGGIFGLFTGFSILSLIEIFYYLTLRAWINKRLFGKFLIKTPQEENLQITK